ncbi:hypothetical protein INT47_000436 [Mucor saturninus]|uniref:Uncharacterized protein n=1 Tax=Mucor saturninus TaxID=64648 RepID=A0A8H7QMJ4_9FUNG|nr:hypothetical protein INT47_000436 [Mucor saturninus]
MLPIDIQELEFESTKKLLLRLDEWRNGICPNGALAKEACFVLDNRPTISIHPDQSSITQQVVTTELITERDWSDNLVDCGAISHLNDDILMKTMSDFFMIFHASDKVNNCNTLHSLQLRKHASFKVDNILRPTSQLQTRIQELLKDETSNLNSKWEELLDIWNKYGYLWPRKIVLGYKIHLKESYKFKDGHDSTNGYYHHINILRERFYRANPKKDHQPFDLEHFLQHATIVSRLDMAPIHEFFDLKSRNAIAEIIHLKFVQIPVYCPIKIFNVYTNSYLCWDPYSNARQDPSFDGDHQDYLVRALSAEPLDLSRAPESQYIWRMTWRPTGNAQKHHDDTFDPEEHRPQTVRGCSKVYIYPACKSIAPKQTSSVSKHPQASWHIHDRMEDAPDMNETHKMVLSCRPYRHETNVQQSEYSKLRPLRLLSNDSLHYPNEKIDWTIEYPDNGLKYMTDAQANIKLNFHEHVRRLKPLLIGDMIQLQQIGLLTAFNPIVRLAGALSPSQQRPNPLERQQPDSSQSLRTARRVVARKPSLKSKCKKNVLCVDEDFTVDSWKENTFWKIELATKADMNRHSNNFIRWPQSNVDHKYGYPKDYHPLLTQDIRTHLPLHFNRETGSLASSTNTSLRRARSLGSLHESFNTTIHVRDDSEKAPYFVNLVSTKSKSKILSKIAKVSLQPLAQLVKPSWSKPKNPHLDPPPFKTHPTS